jgi:hypothetical protein
MISNYGAVLDHNSGSEAIRRLVEIGLKAKSKS